MPYGVSRLTIYSLRKSRLLMKNKLYEAYKKFCLTNCNSSWLVFQQVYFGAESDFAVPNLFDAILLFQCPRRKDDTTYTVRLLATVVPIGGFIGSLSDNQTI